MKGHQSERIPALTILWLRLPWEQTRALRLLNLLTRRELDELSQTEAWARRGERIPQPWTFSWHAYRERPYAIQRAIIAPPIDYTTETADRAVRQFTAMETLRRTTRIILALEAWKLEHGSLPKKLDELVGTYIDHLPVDPYSGQAFRYFPQGLRIPLKWSLPWAMAWTYESNAGRAGVIDADRPFIWSTGVRVSAEPPTNSLLAKTILDEYSIHTNYGQPGDAQYKPLSEYDVWEAGWPFAVP